MVRKKPIMGPLINASVILGSKQTHYDWARIRKAIPQGKARRLFMSYGSVKSALKKIGASSKFKVIIRKRKFVYLIHLR